jgi:hypothetical protein
VGGGVRGLLRGRRESAIREGDLAGETKGRRRSRAV